MKVNKKYLVILIGIFVMGFVIANHGGFHGNQGNINFNKNGKLTGHMYKNCEIIDPIKVSYDITEHNETLKVFNYTASLNFGGRCVQGIGNKTQMNYTSNVQSAIAKLKQDIKDRWDTEFGKNKTKGVPENKIRGGFDG